MIRPFRMTEDSSPWENKYTFEQNPDRPKVVNLLRYQTTAFASTMVMNLKDFQQIGRSEIMVFRREITGFSSGFPEP